MKKITCAELITLIKENTNESVCLDFKQEWHDNNTLLIHDILCLCNADYPGDRFLLIGVSDDAKIIGPIDEANKKDNPKIIDLLRQSNFNRIPHLDVYTLQIDNNKVDIIHISNTSHKPYFLTKDKKNNGKTVRAGVIYSRNGSANTPIDNTASEIEIEKMWRERFGLDRTPLERATAYLSDYEGWFQNQMNYGYYKQFPEFTIRGLKDKGSSSLDCKQEWTRGEIGYHYTPGNSAYYSGIFYHETLLDQIHVVVFDGSKKTIVAPNWEPIGKGRIYFYVRGTPQHSYQQYLTKMKEHDDSTLLRKENSAGDFDIPIFENQSELDKFLQHARNNDNTATEPEGNKEKQNIIFYELLDIYLKWKNS